VLAPGLGAAAEASPPPPPPPQRQAGSERVEKSEVAGEQLREAQAINKSLSALGDVISALQRRTPHVRPL
jgi:hypothetical protein